MPIHRSVLFVACSLVMLAACKPQPEARAGATATPAVAETPTAAIDPSKPTDAAADPAIAAAMTGTADDGKQVLRINTRSGSVDCSGRHVEVFSSGAELTFTGQCLELYFLGVNTRASIQQAQMVQVVADQVGVSVAAPLAEFRQLGNAGQHRIGEVTGELYVQGDGNQIDAQSVGELRLIGNGNRVHWTTGQPDTNDLGNNNIIGTAQ